MNFLFYLIDSVYVCVWYIIFVISCFFIGLIDVIVFCIIGNNDFIILVFYIILGL